MATAAPIFPPSLGDVDDLGDDVRDELRVAWASWWVPLRDELRANPPALDTDAERLAITRFARELIELTAKFGAVLQPLFLRDKFGAVFEELVAQEQRETPALRRLGLKLVERAVEVLGQLFEATLAFAPASSLGTDAAQAFSGTDDEIARSLDAPSVALLRLELYVFVAFDLIHADSHEEFLEWARRAYTASQRAAPFVSSFPAYLRASAEPSAEVALTPVAFERVLALIDSPPEPSVALRQLMQRTPG